MARITRRTLLELLGAAVAVGCNAGDEEAPEGTCLDLDTTCPEDPPPPGLPEPVLESDPFTLGVASGDPLPDAVILWTRLAPDLAAGGGMEDVAVPVRWEVATDPDFTDIVRSGVAVAEPSWGHALHVDATCLAPDTVYWYRFAVGGFTSPVGRTRTLPCTDEHPERLVFAFTTCQNYKAGWYTPYPHLAEDPDVQIVFFLGDYIYESGSSGGGERDHDGPEPTTLDGYRRRYAHYRSDPNLQAAHAAHPWVLTWDDHEVDNDYAGSWNQDGVLAEDFLARRAQAYQAWYEHHPVRVAPPEGPALKIYRGFTWGDLARFWVLDTRQYRDGKSCDGNFGVPCEELYDEERGMLGDEQRAWLLQGLSETEARWNVLAQQVVMTDFTLGGGFVNPDQWDGYPWERQTLLDALAGVDGVLVLTGDIHIGIVARLTAIGVDPESTPIGVELVTPSLTSRNEEFEAAADFIAELALGLPNVDHFNLRDHGYVKVTLTRAEALAEYMVAESTQVPTSPIRRDVAFVVPWGDPVPQRVED